MDCIWLCRMGTEPGWGKRGSDVCTGWGWMGTQRVPGNRSQRVLVRSHRGWLMWLKLYARLQSKICKICSRQSRGGWAQLPTCDRRIQQAEIVRSVEASLQSLSGGGQAEWGFFAKTCWGNSMERWIRWGAITPDSTTGALTCRFAKNTPSLGCLWLILGWPTAMEDTRRIRIALEQNILCFSQKRLHWKKLYPKERFGMGASPKKERTLLHLKLQQLPLLLFDTMNVYNGWKD